MGVSEETAVRQALRLSILRSDTNGTSDLAQEEIMKALRQYPVHNDHCVRIVDKWIAEEKFRPLPVDIRRLAEQIPAAEISSKPDKTCPACYGTGWEEVFTLHTYERGPLGGVFRRREVIGEGLDLEDRRKQYEILRAKVGGHKQAVYSNVQRCTYCRYGKETALAARITQDGKAKGSGAHAED